MGMVGLTELSLGNDSCCSSNKNKIDDFHLLNTLKNLKKLDICGLGI